MHLIKSTKIIIATVALMLAAATVAFAVGASQGQPTLVVHEASDLLGGPTPEPSETPAAKPRPTPERTTFTTSYPEATRAVEKPTKAEASEQPRRAKAASKPAATSKPEPTSSSPAPAPSPTPSTDPITSLVTSLLGG